MITATGWCNHAGMAKRKPPKPTANFRPINTDVEALTITEEERRQIGSSAAEALPKRLRTRQKQAEEMLDDLLDGLPGKRLVILRVLTLLRGAYMAGARDAHETVATRSAAGNAKKSAKKDRRYAEIRREYNRHKKLPKMQRLQATAAATGAGISTVRRAVDD